MSDLCYSCDSRFVNFGSRRSRSANVRFNLSTNDQVACRRTPGDNLEAMAHSVSAHLHVMTADYDRFIRTVIPHYETMRAVQLELLARSLPSHGRVIDLGGGTGAAQGGIQAQDRPACADDRRHC